VLVRFTPPASRGGALAAGSRSARATAAALIDRFRGAHHVPARRRARPGARVRRARRCRPDDRRKYLNTSRRRPLPQGRIVYGADLARAAAAEAGRVVLVEGYTDVIALRQAGVPRRCARWARR
jgi:DNA primase